MDFGGALEVLKRGMKVQRDGWVNCWLKLDKSHEIHWVVLEYSDSFVPWIPTQLDMLSEDWELV